MHIQYDARPSPELADLLFQGINAESAKAKGMRPIESFGFFLRDDSNTVAGGITCVLLFGCLYTDMLWIDERYRGQGWGSKLMALAETLAKDHQCTFATVNTMDWEALPFYQKLGYEIEFTRTGYEKNSTMYLLRKSL